MRKYELMFIVKPNLDEEAVKTIANDMKNVLTSKGATIVEEQEMGQKELAYEMNKSKTGYYFLFVVEANTAAINEFDRLSTLNENILRHIVIKKEA